VQNKRTGLDITLSIKDKITRKNVSSTFTENEASCNIKGNACRIIGTWIYL